MISDRGKCDTDAAAQSIFSFNQPFAFAKSLPAPQVLQQTLLFSVKGSRQRKIPMGTSEMVV